MDAPLAVAPFSDRVFAQGGTMRIIQIAENRLIPRGITAPRIRCTTVTYQAFLDDFFGGKVPDKKSVEPGLSPQVGQDEEFGVQMIVLAI